MQPGVLNIDGGRARLPSTIFDLEGFRSWARSGAGSESVKATYLAGEVLIEMSPESTESHSKPKGEITRALLSIVSDEELGEGYPDRVLLTHVEAELSTEPDFLFASWEAFESGRLRLIGKANREGDYVELEGTPDLVVEIVSDTSVHKDTVLLRAAYHRAGVGELWLVDARSEVSFQILHRADDDFRPSAPAAGPQRSHVLGRNFRLTRSKNRLGRWRYKLAVD
jgi:Uma2 family endonuclease